MLEESPQHIPDWKFDLSGPSQNLLEGIHLFEIKLPVVIVV